MFPLESSAIAPIFVDDPTGGLSSLGNTSWPLYASFLISLVCQSLQYKLEFSSQASPWHFQETACLWTTVNVCACNGTKENSKSNNNEPVRGFITWTSQLLVALGATFCDHSARVCEAVAITALIRSTIEDVAA